MSISVSIVESFSSQGSKNLDTSAAGEAAKENPVRVASGRWWKMAWVDDGGCQ